MLKKDIKAIEKTYLEERECGHTICDFDDYNHDLKEIAEVIDVDMIEDEDVNVYVIPSKTILQGISASIMFNVEASPEENFEEMKAALTNVKSGEVTFAIRDSEINGVHVKKDDFIGIMEKEIVSDNKDKLEVLKTVLSKMVDEDSSLITLIVGEGVSDEEVEKAKEYIAEKYSDLDLDLHIGGQPVYSFLIGVE